MGPWEYGCFILVSGCAIFTHSDNFDKTQGSAHIPVTHYPIVAESI